MFSGWWELFSVVHSTTLFPGIAECRLAPSFLCVSLVSVDQAFKTHMKLSIAQLASFWDTSPGLRDPAHFKPHPGLSQTAPPRARGAKFLTRWMWETSGRSVFWCHESIRSVRSTHESSLEAPLFLGILGSCRYLALFHIPDTPCMPYMPTLTPQTTPM